MGCLVGCLGLLFPRVALFLVWLFGGDYVTRAYDGWGWPLLGFLFLPLTTLTFAYASNSLGTGQGLSPLGWLLTALAVLADIGVIGGGHSRYASYRKERRHERRD